MFLKVLWNPGCSIQEICTNKSRIGVVRDPGLFYLKKIMKKNVCDFGVKGRIEIIILRDVFIFKNKF